MSDEQREVEVTYYLNSEGFHGLLSFTEYLTEANLQTKVYKHFIGVELPNGERVYLPNGERVYLNSKHIVYIRTREV